jgi:hypothetical protein
MRANGEEGAGRDTRGFTKRARAFGVAAAISAEGDAEGRRSRPWKRDQSLKGLTGWLEDEELEKQVVRNARRKRF